MPLVVVAGGADDDPMNPSPTIHDYSAHQLGRGYSTRTIARRVWSLSLWEQHLATHDATLTTATIDHLETFLARWPSPQSRYSIRSDIHQLYVWAILRHRFDCPDPTGALPPPKIPKRLATPIPTPAVRDLIARLSGSDRLIVMLAAHAGLRISEIAAVRGEHVDLDGRWLTVIGKGNREDMIPLSCRLAGELARWPRHGRILPYVTGASVGNRIRTLLRRHGIDGRPHDLRHSFANEAMETSGDNLRVVKELMRHSEITTTMRYLKPAKPGHAIVDAMYGGAA